MPELPDGGGLARLAKQSGEVARIDAKVVCQNDEFEYGEWGGKFHVSWKPNLHDRGALIGAYAVVELKDGSIQADYMTVDEVEKIRQMSKAPNSLMWKDHWGEGAKKTVLKRLCKLVPMSYDLWNRAIKMDNEGFDPIQSTVTATEPSEPGLQGDSLARRLQGGNGQNAGESKDRTVTVSVAEGLYIHVSEVLELMPMAAEQWVADQCGQLGISLGKLSDKDIETIKKMATDEAK